MVYSTVTGQHIAEGWSGQLEKLLAWLRELLAWQILATRASYGSLADDDDRGLYIPNSEVELLLQATNLPPTLVAQRQHLRQAYATILADMDSAATSDHIPLLRIARLYGLSDLERDILLLALAPEIDPRIERVYAYAQDDVTRRRPSVWLVLSLLCPDTDARIAGRTAFAAGGALLRHRLIMLFEDGQRHAPLIGQLIKLDERLVSELLGQPTLDPQLITYAYSQRPSRSVTNLVLPVDLLPHLRRALSCATGGLLIGLYGASGSGRRAVAEVLCAERGIELLTVHLERSPTDLVLLEEMLIRVVREAMLRSAAILWAGAGPLLSGEGPASSLWLQYVDAYKGPMFLALDNVWEPRRQLAQVDLLQVELPELSYSEREQVWSIQLNGDHPGDAALSVLAGAFRLSGGQIGAAVRQARVKARLSDLSLSEVTLAAACRDQSSGRLRRLTQQIRTTYTWDDIVLPPNQFAQLREICYQVRHRRVVLEDWGFERHLAMGKGVNVLFAGPSGTGKTMAAEIVAGELGLDLFRVDLSALVSKYIGETEKNLEQVFAAAREANAVLFFDEADAIFGKRSEVKDAHDRYANIEVGYLLQKMEVYDGMVILATNLKRNLDEAFTRRLHAAIEFPTPEAAERRRIWGRVFPAKAPIESDVNFDLLAQQFQLVGGNIRNIALLAAYLAAAEQTSIAMRHIVLALRREYQKIGRLVSRAEFGPLLELLRGEDAAV